MSMWIILRPAPAQGKSCYYDLEHLESSRPAPSRARSRQDRPVRRRILCLTSYCRRDERLRLTDEEGAEVFRTMKRTEGAVRQKAKTIGIGLGHRR